MLIDLEGTLWRRDLSREGLTRMEEDYRTGEADQPLVEVPEEVLLLLEKLVADAKNEVWLLSGLRACGLLDRIGRRMPKMGIV